MGGLRKLGALIMGAFLVCGAGLTAGCSQNTDTPKTGQRRTRPASRRPQESGQTPSSTIDLAQLLTTVPEYHGRGRNLFAFGPERRVVEAPSSVNTARATTTVPPAPTGNNQQTTHPARIDLKFAGFVEKKEANGANKKYAVFLDGEEILTGAEGELVGNRYTIVEIGLESVTVALAGSQITQRIPLRTN